MASLSPALVAALLQMPAAAALARLFAPALVLSCLRRSVECLAALILCGVALFAAVSGAAGGLSALVADAAFASALLAVPVAVSRTRANRRRQVVEDRLASIYLRIATFLDALDRRCEAVDARAETAYRQLASPSAKASSSPAAAEAKTGAP